MTIYQSRKESNLLETSTNAFLNGVQYHTPDYSKANGTGVIDFTMHWNFENANSAYNTAQGEDHAFADSTWNVCYVDSHDYGPQFCEKTRYTGSEQDWAENMDLLWTFRGIPCIYYGSEIQFQKGQVIDVGPKAPLSTTGRAYFGVLTQHFPSLLQSTSSNSTRSDALFPLSRRDSTKLLAAAECHLFAVTQQTVLTASRA